MHTTSHAKRELIAIPKPVGMEERYGLTASSTDVLDQTYMSPQLGRTCVALIETGTNKQLAYRPSFFRDVVTLLNGGKYDAAREVGEEFPRPFRGLWFPVWFSQLRTVTARQFSVESPSIIPLVSW